MFRLLVSLSHCSIYSDAGDLLHEHNNMYFGRVDEKQRPHDERFATII